MGFPNGESPWATMSGSSGSSFQLFPEKAFTFPWTPRPACLWSLRIVIISIYKRLDCQHCSPFMISNEYGDIFSLNMLWTSQMDSLCFLKLQNHFAILEQNLSGGQECWNDALHFVHSCLGGEPASYMELDKVFRALVRII